MSEQEIIERISKEGYSLLEPYKNTTVKTLLKCPSGHEYRSSLSNFFSRNSRCPICNANKVSKRCKAPHEEVLKICTQKGYTFLYSKEEYELNRNNKNSILILCKCGKQRNITFHQLKVNNSCINCVDKSNKHKHTIEYVKNTIESNGFKLKSNEYLGNKSKLEIECPSHGEFLIRFNDFEQGHSCPDCGRDKTSNNQRTQIETIENFIKEKGGQLLNKEYVNNNSRLDIKCKNGHIFNKSWGYLLTGAWCRMCDPRSSRPERELLTYIRSIYEGKIISNNRQTLDGMELDIWIPEKSFGIEFDGLYFHNEGNKPNILSTIRKKIKKIKEKEISFLGIYSDEWGNANKKRIICSMIKSRLGLSEKKVYARNTALKEVSKDMAKDFMDANHLEGHTPFSFSYGLFDKLDQLIMCITFRYTKGKMLEIARMASVLNTNVIGGASKLISKIDVPLMSYSDNRVGKGDIYKNLGFKEITETFEPSYFYTDGKKRIYRTKCRKLKDLSLGITEREQAKNGAFSKHFGHSRSVYRIYDYGQRKWLKELKK